MFNFLARSAKVLKIQASWDAEARVWYVCESDVPGLHAEAESQEELLEVLKDILPELIEANSHGRSKGQRDVPFELIARRREMLSVGC